MFCPTPLSVFTPPPCQHLSMTCIHLHGYPLDRRNGVCLLDSDMNVWSNSRMSPSSNSCEYLPTSSLVSWQTVVTWHSASAAHHILFKKVSSCCMRCRMGPLHGVTVESEQQPWLLPLTTVVIATAFALSTSANSFYSWRKERTGLGQRMAPEANIGEVHMTRGGGDVPSQCHWFMDAQ